MDLSSVGYVGENAFGSFNFNNASVQRRVNISWIKGFLICFGSTLVEKDGIKGELITTVVRNE